MRDVQPVVAAKGEEQVVTRDAGDGLRLEPEQPSDAVILVDDVVTEPQIGEALEGLAEARVRSRRALPEDLCIG